MGINTPAPRQLCHQCCLPCLAPKEFAHKEQIPSREILLPNLVWFAKKKKQTDHKSCFPLKKTKQKAVNLPSVSILFKNYTKLYNLQPIYSEIPLLQPPKIKTLYPLKILFWNFKLFFSSFSKTSVHLIRDHLWDCPKVVFKTTFGQSQRWSYYRNFTVHAERFFFLYIICTKKRSWISHI